MSDQPNVEVGVAGLNLAPDQFVDALHEQPRDALEAAAAELKQHQIYIIHARDTVNGWKDQEHLINPGYLHVVEDILATAERVLGISWPQQECEVSDEPNRCDDVEATQVLTNEGGPK